MEVKTPTRLPKLDTRRQNSVLKDMLNNKTPKVNQISATRTYLIESSLSNNSFDLPNINENNNSLYTGKASNKNTASIATSAIKVTKMKEEQKGDLKTTETSKVDFNIKNIGKNNSVLGNDSNNNIKLLDNLNAKDIKISNNLENIHIVENSKVTSGQNTKRNQDDLNKSAVKKSPTLKKKQQQNKFTSVTVEKVETSKVREKLQVGVSRTSIDNKSYIDSRGTSRQKKSANVKFRIKNEERENYRGFYDQLPVLLNKVGIKDVNAYLYNYEEELYRLESNMDIYCNQISLIKKKVDSNIRAYILGDFLDAIKACEEVNFPSMLVYTYTFYTTLLMESNNVQELFAVGKKLKSIGYQENNNTANLNGYKILGIACQKSSMHQEALSNFHEMLKLSLLLQDYDKEMDAYDLIGISYYYLNDMNKARYFHKKSILGDYEKSDSRFRAKSVEIKLTQNGSSINNNSGSNINDKGGLLDVADTGGDQMKTIDDKSIMVNKLKKIKKLGITGLDGIFKNLSKNANSIDANRYIIAKEAQEEVKNQLRAKFTVGRDSMLRPKKINTENSRAMYHFALKPPKNDISFGIRDKIGRKVLNKSGGFKSSGESIVRSFQFKKEVNKLYNKAQKSKQSLQELKNLTMQLSESKCTPHGRDVTKPKSPGKRRNG